MEPRSPKANELRMRRAAARTVPSEHPEHECELRATETRVRRHWSIRIEVNTMLTVSSASGSNGPSSTLTTIPLRRTDRAMSMAVRSQARAAYRWADVESSISGNASTRRDNDCDTLTQLSERTSPAMSDASPARRAHTTHQLWHSCDPNHSRTASLCCPMDVKTSVGTRSPTRPPAARGPPEQQHQGRTPCLGIPCGAHRVEQ